MTTSPRTPRRNGIGGQRITIRDVAREAGVSLTTVSDVVNGKGRVDPDTRTRVLATVAELGYRPQRAARALRSGRTGILALCMARTLGDSGGGLVNTDYDMMLALACADAAMDAEQLLLLSPKPRDPGELARLDVDGAIVVDPPQGDPTLHLMDEAGMPVVTVDRDLDRTDQWWVGSDNRQVARTLLDHLAERGARTVSVFSFDAPYAWFTDMHAAYADWCATAGLTPDIRYLDMAGPQAAATALVRELVDTGELPDAILVLPYNAALGVAGAARACGISVPDRLRIASAVDGHALERAEPSITSIDLRPAELGRAAVKLLGQRVAGDAAGGPTFVPVQLRPRGST